MRDFLSQYKCVLPILALVCWTGKVCGQQGDDVAVVRKLLSEIRTLQVMDSGGFYYKGTFPCWRSYGSNGEKLNDNNVFFTGLILFTLRELNVYLTDTTCKRLIGEIRNAGLKSFTHYKNIKGRNIYNFWPTVPPVFFPGARVINFLRKNASLSDDLDDTSIILLAENEKDTVKLNQVFSYMNEVANGTGKRIKNTYKKYKKLNAYSTWFGRKMPIDFDFCVLTNVLYFLKYFGLPINENGKATIDLLGRMLSDRLYLKHPSYISPHYGRTAILIYHYARLMNKFPIVQLEKYRADVIREAKILLSQTKSEMDGVILSTALNWLDSKGGYKDDYSRNVLEENIKVDAGFTFFVAGIYSYLDNPFKTLGATFLKKYHFRCEAYNKTLMLENFVYSHIVNSN